MFLRSLSLSILILFLLPACVPLPGAGGPTPSASASFTPRWATRTPTLTPTIVWFPPTPTPTPLPTRLITPTPDQRPGLGETWLEDDFTDPDMWELARTDEGSIALGKNELTIAIAGEKAYLYTVRRGTVFGDFYAEITASPSLCRSLDEYGLLLRVSEDRDYYRFSLSCDGQARLDRVVRKETTHPQPWVLSGAIPPGAPSTSRLAVWVVGNEMRFFANDEYLFTVLDPLLPSGSLGVFARSDGDMPVTVNFSELVVRKVSVMRDE